MDFIFLANSFAFDMISTVALLIILINGIDGLRKGFALTLLNFIGLIVAFGGAMMLAKPIGNALYSSSIGSQLINTVLPYIEGIDPMLKNSVPVSDSLNTITEGLKIVGLEDGYLNIMIEYVQNLLQSTNGLSLGTYITQALVRFAFIGISFFACYLVLSILLGIAKSIAKKINKDKLLGGINRLLGLGLKLVVGYITVDILIYFISVIMIANPEAQVLFSNLMSLDNDSIFTISKFIFNNNITRSLISALI